MPRFMDDTQILSRLEAVIAERRAGDPAASYVAKLNARGLGKMVQKVGEEATEVVIAALAAHHARDPQGEKTGKGKDDDGARQRLVEESSDLLFHLIVLLRANGVTTGDLAAELSARHQKIGKVAR